MPGTDVNCNDESTLEYIADQIKQGVTWGEIEEVNKPIDPNVKDVAITTLQTLVNACGGEFEDERLAVDVIAEVIKRMSGEVPVVCFLFGHSATKSYHDCGGVEEIINDKIEHATFMWSPEVSIIDFMEVADGWDGYSTMNIGEYETLQEAKLQ